MNSSDSAHSSLERIPKLQFEDEILDFGGLDAENYYPQKKNATTNKGIRSLIHVCSTFVLSKLELCNTLSPATNRLLPTHVLKSAILMPASPAPTCAPKPFVARTLVMRPKSRAKSSTAETSRGQRSSRLCARHGR